jgi:hypothetical protein
LLPPLFEARERIYYLQSLNSSFALREETFKVGVGVGIELSNALVGTCVIDFLADILKVDLNWVEYYLKSIELLTKNSRVLFLLAKSQTREKLKQDHD